MGTIRLIHVVIASVIYLTPVSECLSCYDCSPSPQDNCTEAISGLTRNVTCGGLCYVEMSGVSLTRGCIDDPEESCPQTSLCCDTDLCNDDREMSAATSRPPVQCYQCSYRESEETVTGHQSCTPNNFNGLHSLVKIVDCEFGCSITEVIAEDDSGSEYIISRDCAAEGYCNNDCVELQGGSKSCTTCCNESFCNSEQAASGDSSKENQCYSCSYSKGPSGSIGSPGCYEPFHASGDGIRKVPCDGECSLVVVRNANSVVVQRACQPGCNQSCEKIGDESENCRYCCSGSLCNSATYFADDPLRRLVYSLLVAVSLMKIHLL